ncbi:hypothetical protein CYY_002986 [Polysphondylium violaceum]|uniref:TLDc domain-containing protein n=1 Tax=Polysphondylium violaceum TaxID=133409 RepID=A0A8J4PXD2_9MYCE|nr:hypothetical protein CYY_002986 [Polysphondylium violaceum]
MASNYGFSASAFHLICNDKGPTITLIETTDGCVFGGYNSQSWISSDNTYSDDKCFIFTLVYNHGIQPTKYFPVSPKTTYVINYGPCFGSDDVRGHRGTQYFPKSSSDTTGKGDSNITPSKEFMIQDYEVYQCLVD